MQTYGAENGQLPFYFNIFQRKQANWIFTYACWRLGYILKYKASSKFLLLNTIKIYFLLIYVPKISGSKFYCLYS